MSLEGSLLESSRSLLALLELRCISACTAACEPRERRQRTCLSAWSCRREVSAPLLSRGHQQPQRPPDGLDGHLTAPCIINEGVLARMIMPAARAVDVCAEQGKDMAGSCGRRQKSTRRAQRELH